MVKAAELVSSCGGQVMVWYKDEYGHVAVFCSSDELYKQYCTDGVKRTTVDNRITLDELEPNYPTPTKTSNKDCNFTVTRPFNVPLLLEGVRR